MMIVCNGRRMGKKLLDELATSLEFGDLRQHLEKTGYTLQPVRAPRGLNRGRLSIRLVWQKRDGDIVHTIRVTTTLHQPKTV